MTRKHFKHFPIAGFTYWEGPLAFNKLKVGRELHLIAEPDNRYDPMAVAVYYKRYKLGYIPKNANAEISTLLQLGHTHLFQAVVQRIDATENPENQVGVVVYGVGEEN